eukprot:jgi/Botrbrau1/7380/Bobra.0316s0023.2
MPSGVVASQIWFQTNFTNRLPCSRSLGWTHVSTGRPLRFGRSGPGRPFGHTETASRCPFIGTIETNSTERLRGLREGAVLGEVGAEALTVDLSGNSEFKRFQAAASKGNLVPLYERLLSDQLTPVLAYRCLVTEDDREAPSFLFESVVNGDQQGRYSFVGAQPAMEVLVEEQQVTVLDHAARSRTVTTETDPLEAVVQLSSTWRPVPVEGLPEVFTGGWVGYCGYDTVRYVYKGKLPFSQAPPDQDGLPDLHLALYNEVVVFDHATKLLFTVVWVHLDRHASVESAYLAGKRRLQALADRLTPVTMSVSRRPNTPQDSNMTKEQYMGAVEATKEYIQAGDIFQLVLSQRFRRRTFADPFEVYRALRIVNPSPYMIYLQARGSILVASSPEILCRLDAQRTVTNRPLAGTRRRGRSSEEDRALEAELLSDAKECAEHVMLVDLGRNDVGRVAQYGTVKVEKLMEVERYSHVMHISSTVTGLLKPELSCWDVLRAALPAGTVSGAPKVRAMQIIDELEVNKRGPYGGGIGHVSFSGSMDFALALRTMVIPTMVTDAIYDYGHSKPRREWKINLQAGAGLVADSLPEAEYEETVNKAAALGRAIDLAEQVFLDGASAA